jgi:uncharacterized protein (TIRG00374 family)
VSQAAPTRDDRGPEPDASSRRRPGAAVWIGIVLSVVAGTLLLWRVSFRDLLASLRAANGVWLLPSLAVFFAMYALRAWRWAVLLGDARFWPTWHANTIGYFFNVTLPLRLGEIARAYVVSKNEGIPMARALSAVLVERLLDLASVVLLFAAFALRIPMGPTFTRAATIGSIALVVCVAGSVLVVLRGQAVERALAPRLARLGANRAEAILGRFRQIREGLASVGSARRMGQCVLLTVAVWAVTIVLAAVCLKAFLPEMDFVRPGFMVVSANLGGALPSAPGGLGIVQGFATSALVLPFGVPESTALAYVLVWSLGQQLILILLGFVSIGRVGLSFREIREGAQVPTAK